ncbi:glycosyltransferase family 2 protein [Mucilaginibacter limnophilus]|uniref:Glycosyltransferase family 2 protein n=1 Tax=Mucilaginibacter limnophilus TaxID=1932778 RepID=A0A437MS25_9SPHI|nr:glycosyltransferase family A protein [Mucilaginibacter limnophilus]RVU00436.1 glycosyltransferase family 2 protein [Mucilaginibacter limnophilus]
MLKISFCTVCMNRLQHLKETLQANIEANQDYANLEFVLLDYNSTDGVEDYIRNHMSYYIKSGKLVYYKTTSHLYFNRSHSRNVAFRLATGDVLCNIDADNFTGIGFAAYVNEAFSKANDIFLSVFNNNLLNKSDVLGRICVRKADFYKVTGYDERMVNYGFEDYDLVNRLELYGLTKTPITGNPGFFNVIEHERNTRLENEYLTNKLNDVLISYLSPSSSEVLLLLTDNTYKRGVVIDNKSLRLAGAVIDEAQQEYQYSILGDEWAQGLWSGDSEHIDLYSTSDTVQTLFYETAGGYYTLSDMPKKLFYQVSSHDLIEQVIMFCSQVTNRIYMWKNKLNKTYAVNSVFGNDTVYKNLNFNNPIYTHQI